MAQRLRQSLLGVDTSVGRFASQSLLEAHVAHAIGRSDQSTVPTSLQPLDGSCSLLEESHEQPVMLVTIPVSCPEQPCGQTTSQEPGM